MFQAVIWILPVPTLLSVLAVIINQSKTIINRTLKVWESMKKYDVVFKYTTGDFSWIKKSFNTILNKALFFSFYPSRVNLDLFLSTWNNKKYFRRKDGLMRHFLAKHNSSEEFPPSTADSLSSSSSSVSVDPATLGTWKAWTCMSCNNSYYGKYKKMK